MMWKPKRQYGQTAERGAAATIIAVLLAGGVLLGGAAIAIDVGNLMFERRQLQNGADAAVMELASECAKDLNQCDDDARAAGINALNSANASDSVAALDTSVYPQGQCGRDAGAGMPPCTDPGDISDLGKCPPLPDWLLNEPTIPYVETYTRTATTAGDNLLAPYFGIGDGTEVRSCARAAWGPPGGASVLPITFSYCEWEDAVAKQGFGDYPVNVATPYKGETALVLKYKVTGTSTTDPCVALGHSGMDAPGGFGWLDQTACVAEVGVDGWVNVDTGKSGPAHCVSAGQVIYIPIFNCVSKTKTLCDNVAGGANTYYHVDGFAAFYVTAILDMPGNPDTQLAGYPGTVANAECGAESNNNKGCIFGWFLDEYVDFSSGVINPGGTNYGVKKVLPAG